MGNQLGFAAGEGRNGADRHDLTVGMAQVVAGENVAEKMGLEVVVRCWYKAVIERFSRQAGLDFGPLLQSIISSRKRIGVLPRIVVDPGRQTGVQDLFQCAECVERTRKSRVCIQLRKRLFGFADGESLVKCLGQRRFQAGLVSLGLEGGDDGKSLPPGSKCVVHFLGDCYQAGQQQGRHEEDLLHCMAVLSSLAESRGAVSIRRRDWTISAVPSLYLRKWAVRMWASYASLSAYTSRI